MYKDLSLGDIGDDVKILQQKLKMLGLYNPIITGSFGMATYDAVVDFQNKVGLDPTGEVNQDFWNKLNQYTEVAVSPISVYPTLKIGATGEYVKDLQTKLKNLLYYNEAVTGNFDLETENAVKRFQLNNDLTADGIVGNATWNGLNSSYGNLSDCVINNDEDNTDNDYIKYTVVSGDTLYGIARRYNTTVDAIKKLNNLTTDILQIGQVLNIPTSFNDYINYIVKSGDRIFMGNH